MYPSRKDPALAAILGFLFGGFGLFYISAGQGFAALAVLIVGSLITGGFGAPLLWLGCAVWGYLAAKNHNERHGQFMLEDQETAGYFSPNPPPAGPYNRATGGYPRPTTQYPAQPQPSWAPGPAQQHGGPVSSNFCGQCGHELRANTKFCTGCGSPI